MPNIDFSQLSAMPLTELVFAEPSGAAARSESDHLFDDYLKRANAPSSLPANDSPTAKDRNADRSSPQADKAKPPAERSEAASLKRESADRKPSNETSSGVQENDAASENSSPATNENAKEHGDVKNASQSESKESDSKSSEDATVKDKENEKDKDGSPVVAESTVAVGKNSADLPVVPVAQLAENVAQKADGEKQSSDEAESLQEVAAKGVQMVDPLARNVEKSAADAKAKADAAMKGAEVLQKQEAAGKQMSADLSPDAIEDVSGDGKSKAKKTRETAEGKNVHGKQKTAGESQATAATKQEPDSQSTAAGSNSSENAQTPSVVTQTATNTMQSVLDVLKNAEKPAVTQDAVGSITDTRTNSSMSSAKTSTASAAKANPASTGTDTTAQVARAQFVQRVERAFAAMGDREGSVRLKLSPPELGILKLEIGVHKGVMKARVEAETPAAKSLLLDNLPELRERLAQQNIHIQQFDVDLMDRQPGGMPQNAFGQSDSGSQQNNRPSSRTNESENAAAISAAAPQRAGMGGSLNLFV
jgi:flagellar hook-length control protein FliK